MDPDNDRKISEHVLRMHRYRKPGEQEGEGEWRFNIEILLIASGNFSVIHIREFAFQSILSSLKDLREKLEERITVYLHV